MNPRQVYCMLDYETRSEANLKVVGAAEYAAHPSTKVLCVAWKVGTRAELRTAPTRLWNTFLYPDSKKAAELEELLEDNTIILVAHNAGFEELITQHVLPKHLEHLQEIPIERWECTAAIAAAHALPRHLEGACDVLKLAIRKNPEGKKLIQRYCVPQRITKNQPHRWRNDREGLLKLGDYCATDVEAQVELFLTLPPLTRSEQEVWRLNQRINMRGVFIDRPFVERALKIIERENTRMDAETKSLTTGAIARAAQRAAVLDWARARGVDIPDLKAKTLADTLAAPAALDPRARRLLEIRQLTSKSSLGKFPAFWARSHHDGRLRDLQMYHGASTGRETATGVQTHNVPRGHLEDAGAAIADLMSEPSWWARALHGDLMSTLSSCLRGVMRATPGYVLFCGDFAAIEARVLFWLARHQKGLALFAAGHDLYRDQATSIFDRPYEEIGDPSFERFVGKETVLGCGFQMGWKRFIEQCKAKGIEISVSLAKKSIGAYRTKHKPVTNLWTNLEAAAIAAVETPGREVRVNRVMWVFSGKFLYCELPSGRRLAYYGPHIRVVPFFGREKKQLRFWGVHPKTKKWCVEATYGGKLTENVVQAVARDLMVAAQLRTEAAGYIPLMSIHDELLAERRKGGSEREFENLMSELPPWAEGLPIKVKAWSGERYRK